MKLIDLLVKELPAKGGWPEAEIFTCEVIAQDADGSVWSYPIAPVLSSHRWGVSNATGKALGVEQLCEDWNSSIVTREQYEAALNVKPGEEVEELPKPSVKHSAHSFLEKGVKHMKDRAAQRDSEDGERSMKACVDAFNAMFGHNLTETQGWQFMVLLKMARSRNKFNPDDYEDGAAYTGLAGEAHSNEQN